MRAVEPTSSSTNSPRLGGPLPGDGSTDMTSAPTGPDTMSTPSLSSRAAPTRIRRECPRSFPAHRRLYEPKIR
jgi:hypothetical protein